MIIDKYSEKQEAIVQVPIEFTETFLDGKTHTNLFRVLHQSNLKLTQN